MGNHLGMWGFMGFRFKVPSLSYIPGKMKCDSWASLLAPTFASPCLGYEPKVGVMRMKIVNNLKQCQNNLWEHCWGVGKNDGDGENDDHECVKPMMSKRWWWWKRVINKLQSMMVTINKNMNTRWVRTCRLVKVAML